MTLNLDEIKNKQEKIQKSRDGRAFDENADYWQLNKNTRVRLRKIRQILPNELHEGFQQTLVYYAKHKSAASTQIAAEQFLTYLNSTINRYITAENLINF